MSNVENLILEHLKKIQAEQSAVREKLSEVIGRLGQIENGIQRIDSRESHNYGEVIQDRHRVDRLIDRIERIERRLEIEA